MRRGRFEFGRFGEEGAEGGGSCGRRRCYWGDLEEGSE
jgi:hypothetical protein